MGVDFWAYSRVKTEPIPQQYRDVTKHSEFLKTLIKDNDFIGVCFQTNIIYRSTPETVVASATRSYSGYGDFMEEMKFLNNGIQPYFPPSTESAPEYGFITADKSLLCLTALNKFRSHFVSNKWQPDIYKYIDIEEKDDDIHNESWFFREFYIVMSLGSDAGVVLIH